MTTGFLKPAEATTWFVVQAYRKGRRGALVPEEPKMARDERQCLSMAERMSTSRPAVVAFSRQGDNTTGDFDEPVILASYGDVPEMG